MLWRKPDGLRYVDLCIYIDQNVGKILHPGEYPKEEELIWNYLYLLIKAIAIKKRLFNNFSDYDGYAMYGAKRIFFALRRNLENNGKVVKGKEIKPIKSVLNYTKALLYPMKLEYIHEQAFTDFTAADVASKFDKFTYKQQLRQSLVDQQQAFVSSKLDAELMFKNIVMLIDQVLEKSPFKKNTLDYKKLKISILINCLQNISNKKSLTAEPNFVVVWKMPKSISSYIRFFMKLLETKIKHEIMDDVDNLMYSDKIVDYMISNVSGEFVENESKS